MHTLYAYNKKGDVKQWTISVEETDGIVRLKMDSGLRGGKLATRYRLVQGKNIGRKNETSPLEQANKEMESRVSKKMDEGYRLSVADLNSVPVRPMLAHKWADHKHKLEYPVIVQPKLNGVRCTVTRVDDDNVVIRSKKGKVYELPHLAFAALPLLELGARLDGEIYVHGWALQRIVSAVKAYNEDTPQLQLHVYDFIPEDDMSCNVRQNILAAALAPKADDPEDIASKMQYPIKWTYTAIAENEEAVDGWHDNFIEAGYEGTMIRVPESLYEQGFRTDNLLKRKDFIDEEFEIVGWDAETLVKDDETSLLVIWKCITKDGHEFAVVPKGTDDKRKEWYDKAEEFIGKQLTVRYLELSEKGVPIGNTVGLEVRDYE